MERTSWSHALSELPGGKGRPKRVNLDSLVSHCPLRGNGPDK